jgi:hypothetical protein
MSVSLGSRTAKPVVVLATPASEGRPMPSPDNRWLAYVTNASGTAETRIAPLGDVAASVQVSTRRGGPIRWSRDGSTLYYTDGPAIASVNVGPRGPELSSRREVFPLPNDWRGCLDVMPDGSRAVMIRGGLIYSDVVVLQRALTNEK